MKYALLAVVLVLASCRLQPPAVEMQGYFFVGAPDEATAQKQNPELLLAVTEVITAIVNEDRELLLKYVSKDEGAIIDAKAFVSYAQIRTALYDAQSQLARVFWDDKYWRETAPNDNIQSYRKTFGKAETIRAGFFWYSPSECEVRLDFPGRPSMGIMGNPIFRKRGAHWHLMNFF